MDLVVDIGKTHSRLLVLDRSGHVVSQAQRASATRRDGPWPALDTEGVETWLRDALIALGPLRARLATASFSAHGAAIAAVDGDRLAWPVPDYEWAGFDERPTDWLDQIGPFDETQSPDLPRGLNAATQLDWLERHHPDTFKRGQLLPYAQYWAWWFSGVAASEVSSLGCHTHLWNPGSGGYSQLAERRAWATRFAPLRKAWEVLGTVRPQLARELGLPPGLRIHTGVHDSNACLARYLRSHPRMTLVSTGTWVVVMAPGAAAQALEAERDMLCNVSVRQEPVPTARFMGGRELQALCAGADPALANLDELGALLEQGLMALPGFEPQGGPFRTRAGAIVNSQGDRVALDTLPPAARATLAALYAAQVTAWLVERLGATGPLIVEGPFAHNPVFTGVLAALVPASVMASIDELEGTARGAWMLAHWTQPGITLPATLSAEPVFQERLRTLHAEWCREVAPEAVTR